MLDRTEILRIVRSAVEPLSFVNAMWEGGSAAWGRSDEWSDIDLQIDVADGRVEDAFAAIEAALAAEAPVDLRYVVPRPTWHGHAQAFYRLRGASPYLQLDLCVIEHSNPNKFLEPEMHGRLVVHFDRCGVVQQLQQDHAAIATRLMARAAEIVRTAELFHTSVLKELHRDNRIEAIAFYFNQILRPLVEMLRIRYSPGRSTFHTRYIHYDLPAPVAARLEPMFYMADAAALRQRFDEARAWIVELAGGIERDEMLRLLDT